MDKKTPHTQTTTGKQSKSRKQPKAKPRVWCGASGAKHPHKEKTQKYLLSDVHGLGLKAMIGDDDTVFYGLKGVFNAVN